ncbi:MAG: hypothetical protein A2667_02800 [Candidatus Wildermuthbacteria bacterium RIFCSPHIGHO2_01_FULL_47_27]|nr:MAG: hypothetical protein UY15_C0014G0011 [Parcubacteria group bacterium GW2011_GWA2_47_9]OHA65050.1 MAG: hypothetical protein A2667_02800 [Candidatus Wildermuthbacteria bacterium RIFCSPHIGHO2_01_FULL_47_27]OHA75388.1 MAG: hypothetical protein A3I38_01215 [Candidatus Wildermuthbacteria bacterium RIFCSPLOWO2_02_FULL_47_10]
MPIIVTVGEVATAGKRGKLLEQYALDGGQPTAGDALKVAGLSAESKGYHVYVNNKPASGAALLRDGDTVLLMPAVRGA